MHLADILTSLRIVLTPVCILFILWSTPHSKFFAFAIFVLAAITDILDGYVARTKKQTTNFGSRFDPLADKILIISVLISLAFVTNEVWCWTAIGIIWLREIVVFLMRIKFAPKGVSIEANNYGKLKTLTQCIAVGVLILQFSIAPYLLWTAVFFSVYSGIYYIGSWNAKQHVTTNVIGDK